MAVSKDPSHMFAAPIPGAGLTGTPNSSPWEQPSQFTDLHEALTYMWNIVFKDPATVMQILAFLKKDIAVTEIVNTFLFTGVAGGKWNLDLALLMYPTVCHQIETIAKLRNIKYTFKRVDPKVARFVKDFSEYLQEPTTEPVKKAATKMFATGLGLDEESGETTPDNEGQE